MKKNNQNQVAINLLAAIAGNATDSKEARIACDKFDKMFRERILRSCLIQCSSFEKSGLDVDPEELYQDIIGKIFRIAGKVNPSRGNFFSWVNKITFNEMLSRYRKQIKQINQSREYKKLFLKNWQQEQSEYLFLGQEFSSAVSLKANLRLEQMKIKFRMINEILDSIAAVQKDITLTKMKYAPGDMPKDERIRIATTYDIAEDSIKTYWMRAKKAIEMALGRPVDWSLFETLAKSKKS